MKSSFIDSVFLAALTMVVITATSLAGAVVYLVAAELAGGADLTELASADVAGVEAFDPNRLPPPGAGIAEQGKATVFSCDDAIYMVSEEGIKHVRASGGGAYYAAVVNKTFGLYRLDYSYLTQVDDAELAQEDIAKLKYALNRCKGPYVNSGARFYTGPSGGAKSARREGTSPAV